MTIIDMLGAWAICKSDPGT